MKKILFAFAVSSLALAACGERAADTNDTATTADGTTVTTDNTGMATDDQAAINATPMGGDATTGGMSNDAQEYVTQAASSDQYEIQSSQLALQQSKNTEVRQFAQQMIDQHRASTQKLQTASTGAALQAPRTEMLPAHRAKLDELREETGAEFDEKYLEQQREAHAEALALHQAMANSQNAPAQLTGFAREAVPIVQGHARMLEGMKIDD